MKPLSTHCGWVISSLPGAVPSSSLSDVAERRAYPWRHSLSACGGPNGILPAPVVQRALSALSQRSRSLSNGPLGPLEAITHTHAWRGSRVPAAGQVRMRSPAGTVSLGSTALPTLKPAWPTTDSAVSGFRPATTGTTRGSAAVVGGWSLWIGGASRQARAPRTTRTDTSKVSNQPRRPWKPRRAAGFAPILDQRLAVGTVAVPAAVLPTAGLARSPACVRTLLAAEPGTVAGPRSEERRVGKECRSRWSP